MGKQSCFHFLLRACARSSSPLTLFSFLSCDLHVSSSSYNIMWHPDCFRSLRYETNVYRNYGLPLHLVRELYETFRNFKSRVSDFIRYRKITSNMNERFPDATPEELSRSILATTICLLFHVFNFVFVSEDYISLGVMLHA